MCQAVGSKCAAQERGLDCIYKYTSCPGPQITKAMMLKKTDIQGIVCRKQREVLKTKPLNYKRCNLKRLENEKSAKDIENEHLYGSTMNSMVLI